jgi:uncharacterized protein YgbK (DUF1537 family)
MHEAESGLKQIEEIDKEMKDAAIQVNSFLAKSRIFFEQLANLSKEIDEKRRHAAIEASRFFDRCNPSLAIFCFASPARDARTE